MCSIVTAIDSEALAVQEKMKDFKADLEEKRAVRLAKRKEQRKEERRQKWLKDKAEEEQRKKDEELKKSESACIFFMVTWASERTKLN